MQQIDKKQYSEVLGHGLFCGKLLNGGGFPQALSYPLHSLTTGLNYRNKTGVVPQVAMVWIFSQK